MKVNNVASLRYSYYIFRIVNGLSGQAQAHAQTVAVRMDSKADKGNVYFEIVILLAALVLGVLTILSVVHEEIVLLGHNGRDSDLAAHLADNEANKPAQEAALSRVKERKLDEQRVKVRLVVNGHLGDQLVRVMLNVVNEARSKELDLAVLLFSAPAIHVQALRRILKFAVAHLVIVWEHGRLGVFAEIIVAEREDDIAFLATQIDGVTSICVVDRLEVRRLNVAPGADVFLLIHHG